jgi:hypothetical protein
MKVELHMWEVLPQQTDSLHAVVVVLLAIVLQHACHLLQGGQSGQSVKEHGHMVMVVKTTSVQQLQVGQIATQYAVQHAMKYVKVHRDGEGRHVGGCSHHGHEQTTKRRDRRTLIQLVLQQCITAMYQSRYSFIYGNVHVIPRPTCSD